jgi:hypothetical protein
MIWNARVENSFRRKGLIIGFKVVEENRHP